MNIFWKLVYALGPCPFFIWASALWREENPDVLAALTAAVFLMIWYPILFRAFRIDRLARESGWRVRFPACVSEAQRLRRLTGVRVPAKAEVRDAGLYDERQSETANFMALLRSGRFNTAGTRPTLSP